MSTTTSGCPGSPPRMRGEAARVAVVSPAVGITPAYAGRRSCWACSYHRARDHPRVCGEKPIFRAICASPMGSPPRMRGEGDGKHQLPVLPGITPAYAGRSPSSPGTHAGTWDHPRVCGEKRRRCFSATHPPGSPPRMRGEAVQRLQLREPAGITPAYAGRSSSRPTIPP